MADPKPVGDLSLRLRSAAVRTLARVYPIGVAAGASVMIPLGGFVPVLRGWLGDEVHGWGGVVEALGGVHVVTEIRDPDADLGPVLVRLDAPTLFQAVADVARRLGVKPPDQIRLAYLPCCGVVAWRRSRILLLGLPLLQVLTQAELRAVLAHELAHLARGDVAHSAGASRFVHGLGRALDRRNGRVRGPLGAWAKLSCGWPAGSRPRSPAARRPAPTATRPPSPAATPRPRPWSRSPWSSPSSARSSTTTTPTATTCPTSTPSSATFWRRLPTEVREAMRLQLLVDGTAPADSPHPALPDRLAVLQSFPSPPEPPGDRHRPRPSSATSRPSSSSSTTASSAASPSSRASSTARAADRPSPPSPRGNDPLLRACSQAILLDGRRRYPVSPHARQNGHKEI